MGSKCAISAVMLGVLACAACGPISAPKERSSAPPTQEAQTAQPSSATIEWPITTIEWDDADSGRINGVRFRLKNMDAPETGGVGAAIGGAECELERTRGTEARNWIVALTENARLQITGWYGFDAMEEPRMLIDLAADGVDVGRHGIEAGHLAAWPHAGTRRLAPKPDWCVEGEGSH